MQRICLLMLFMLGVTSRAAAVEFTWQPIAVPPADPIYSGNWSTIAHWNNGTFIPSDPNDTAGIGLSGVPAYTVTMDLDTHIGTFIFDSSTATLEGVSRVFRVDGMNDFTQGTVNWDNSQILDSGAGTLTNAATMNVTRDVLIDVATFNQRDTVNVSADTTFHTTLTSTYGISNRGLINVFSPVNTNATMIVSTGTLVNDAADGLSGELRFDGAGTGLRRFDGNLQNEAFVNVLADTTYARAGDTITNTGSFFIAPGATLKMQAGTQVFNQDANSLDVQGTFNPISTTFNFNGGTVSNNAVTLFNSTLNIGPSAGNGAFVLRGASSYSGNLQAGQLLTVRADVLANSTATAAAGFTNNSTLTIESTAGTTAQLTVNGGPLVNQPAGIIDFNGATGTRRLQAELDNAGAVNINGDTLIGATAKNHLSTGEIVAMATATFLGDTFTNQVGGVIHGDGELDVSGITFMNEGEIAPGTSFGDLLITGDAPFGSTSALSIELGGTNVGTEYDRLSVNGMATLGGTLSIELLNDFAPSAADLFTVLSATTLNGAFTNVADGARIDLTNGAGSFLVNYDGVSNAVVLSDFFLNLAGDFDVDGNVDGLDFLKWQRGFGDIYDSADLAEWEANYGMVASLIAASAVVPEPATVLMAGSLGVVYCLQRRRP